MSKPVDAVANENVEAKLEEGYKLGDVTYNLGDDKVHVAKNSKDHKVHDSNGGWIPQKHHGFIFNVVVGFVVAFFADFGARSAYQAYEVNRLTVYAAPEKSKYELLFYANMVVGCMYLATALMIVTPVVDKMFFSLFWDPKHFPAPKSPAHFLSRNMGLVVIATSLAQLVQPSNTGVGIVALCANVMVSLNFLAAVVFDHYEGLRNRNLMWPGFVVGGIVFVSLFAVGLERLNFFHGTWKDDSQHQQTMMFYLNMIGGLSYLPLGLICCLPGGDTWFLQFFFKGEVVKPQSPSAFFSKNMALLMTGICAAQIIAPGNVGVGVVMFFVHLLQVPNMLAAFLGHYENVVNKMLWAGFAVAPIVFTCLYGVALHRLDDCNPADATCGSYAGWMDRKWDMSS